MAFYDSRFPERVSAAERKLLAAREAKKLANKGCTLTPVVIQGKDIAKSFWGRAWCDNLEAYSDFENRLPRGRSYTRNGSIIDLQISEACVTALVQGSSLYKVKIDITPLTPRRWAAVVARCVGQIHSMVELLKGALSEDTLAVLIDEKTGLFPAPKEMAFACSCPDGAWMCKHVAAALYGVGHRLDGQPELFFVLRKVDQADLIKDAAGSVTTEVAAGTHVLESTDLSAIFGVQIETAPPATITKPTRNSRTEKSTTSKRRR